MAVTLAFSLARLLPLLLCWRAAGWGARSAHLPTITGVILAGVLSGPAVSGALSEAVLSALAGFEKLCLATIVLSAGTELHLDALRKSGRQVLCVTAAISAVSWLGVAAFTIFLTPWLPFARGLSSGDALALATFMGTIAVARSPVSALAVVRDAGGHGPFCTLVLAVAVVKDTLLFVLFALNLQFALLFKNGLGGSAARVAFQLCRPLLVVALSAALGVGVGLALAWAVRCVAAAAAPLGEEPPLQSAASLVAIRLLRGCLARVRALCSPTCLRSPACLEGAGPVAGPLALALRRFSAGSGAWLAPPPLRAAPILAAALAVRWLSQRLETEALVTAVVAGVAAVNALRRGAEERAERAPEAGHVLFEKAEQGGPRQEREEEESAPLLPLLAAFSADLDALLLWVSPAFFGLLGARLRLHAVAALFWVAALVCVVRALSVAAGARLGAAVGKVPPAESRRLWMAMITQAGIGLGLARTLHVHYPVWGDAFAAIQAGCVLINIGSGPPLFRAAIVANGEARGLGGQTHLSAPAAASS